MSFTTETHPRAATKVGVSSTSIGLDSGRSWHILLVLTLSFGLSFLDRQLLNLLVDPVKRTLLLSDTEISLLQGAAFVSAYCLAAPLFGRLADLVNRRNILIAGVLGWTSSTFACGMADTFYELALTRFGMGFFEASVVPVAWSMIPDLFSRQRSPHAYSIFMLGPPVGSSSALLTGGAIVAFASGLRSNALLSSLEVWQICFLTVGATGLFVVLLICTFREPARIKDSKSENCVDCPAFGIKPPALAGQGFSHRLAR